MVTQELMEAAKLRLRKTQSDLLDEDVRQLCEVAIVDLKRIGVDDKHLLSIADPLIKEAVLTYVNANYGSNPDREKLMASYDMLLTKSKGGAIVGDEILTLIAEVDAETEEKIDIFGTVESIGQKEFFAAAQSGLKAEYKITVWQSDYDGQDIVELNNQRYSVYRTFCLRDGHIELYLASKVGV